MGRLAIIGAGFAGWRAARALRAAAHEVTVFEPRAAAEMLPALPDLAGGWLEPRLLSAPLANLLPKGMRHDRRLVTSLDPVRRVLLLGGDETPPFDGILLATGSRAAPHPFAERAEAVHTLDSISGALRLRDAFARYLARARDAHVVVAGGGYTGLELSASLAARAWREGRACRVTVLEAGPDILPFLPDSRRAAVRLGLRRLGVDVHTGVRVERFDGADVKAGGETLRDVFLCWTAGSIYSGPELSAPMARLRDGRLLVQNDLSLPGNPAIFVAGDAAAVTAHGEPLRKAVNFAWYEGAHAARNLLRRARGAAAIPFQPVDLGWVIPLHTTSVGRLPGGLWVRGRLGLRLHYLMCGVRNFRFTNRLGFARLALTLFGRNGA